MTDLFGHLDDLSAHELKPEILAIIKTQGVSVAIRAMIEMIGDSGTPAAARATLVGLMFRIGGFLEKHEPEGLPPSEMSIDQLRRSLPLMESQLARLDAEIAARQVLIDATSVDDDEADVDIFA